MMSQGDVMTSFEYFRGVETVGPVGHGHLRSDSSTVLSDQMSERTPEYLKCYLGDISACIGPTVKYDPWNHIRILQTVHICNHLGDLGPFSTWKFILKVHWNFSVWRTEPRTDKHLSFPVRMTGMPTWVFNMSGVCARILTQLMRVVKAQAFSFFLNIAESAVELYITITWVIGHDITVDWVVYLSISQ